MAIMRAVMETMFDFEGILVGRRVWFEDEIAARNGGERAARYRREYRFRYPLVNQVEQLGEPLYRKIEPTGYSNSSREWMNTAGLMARMNFALQLAGNKVPGVTVDQAAASAGALGSPEFQKR